MIFPREGRRWADSPNWWAQHSLSIVLTALLVVQSIVFHFTRYPTWASEELEHKGSVTVWPDYALHYTSEWFVSVLADTYGALLLVVLTKWFYERGSAESNG